MKRLLSLLLAFLLLTSCASEQEQTEETSTTEEVDNGEQEVEDVEETKEDKVEEKEEETEDVKVETDAEDESPEESVGTMDTDQMIENSDAIAKVKYYHKNGEKHYKILEIFRGNFNESFEKPTVDLMENRPYLFFYREENGKLIPTNGDNSYLLLEGDMHEIFEKIKH
ncbi:MAG: hypothetical protein Q4P28_02730 [Tissierellia bacterium]|nr:hypothetical protein [Tissierellia bacterium]